MFDNKPLIKVFCIDNQLSSEDKDINSVLELALDYPVEDVIEDNFGNIDVFPESSSTIELSDLLKDKGYNILFNGNAYIPTVYFIFYKQTTMEISENNIPLVNDLLNRLYEESYVQNVTHNAINIEQMYY